MAEKKMSSRTIKVPRIYGIYEIAGGAIGVGGSLLFFRASSLLMFIGLLLFGFSILAGYLLNKGKLWGIYLSLFSQIIQIPAFTLQGLSYKFYAGACLYIRRGITTAGSQFTVNLSILASGCHLFISQVPEMRYISFDISALNFMSTTTAGDKGGIVLEYIGLNLVAIALTVVLFIFLVKKLAQAKMARQPSDELKGEPREGN